MLLVSTAVTVIFLVPPTVKTTRVTYRVERVSRVKLDGLEHIVIQVRLQIVCVDVSNFTCFFQIQFRLEYNFQPL